MSEQKQKCQNVKCFQNVSKSFKKFQNISKSFKQFQKISKSFKIDNLENHAEFTKKLEYFFEKNKNFN